ncbi:hypothetical protein [Lyngbya sp. CCY1209]|uniref:hypothetical protein n=1 Tax=Lyngbya sp. CCY1209 TaxID=2886103 RepID=UPI002D20E335|nr:hypothetical protein [Lyngbya sp. CCY1209]MEB3882023.1 hypothetical protein [Lyngbya sp. CCY1209]
MGASDRTVAEGIDDFTDHLISDAESGVAFTVILKIVFNNIPGAIAKAAIAGMVRRDSI